MGNGIAQVFAQGGLQRRAARRLGARRSTARAAAIEKSLAKFVEKGKLAAADRDAALAPPRDRRRSRRVRRGRLRRRGDRRETSDAKRELFAPARRDRPAGRHPRLEHVVDLDHRARRGDEAARQRARHALHEPRAADGARRADPRPGDVGRDDAARPPTSARRSARRRSRPPTTPASSPTAS